ncbi:hypothetical protein [Bacillus sp. JCM 19041]|uniref:hypothetical protein n=1 Tax=Bacillus sp. JCM 19041 TaxID=1460637 RepID=UPI0006D24BA1
MYLFMFLSAVVGMQLMNAGVLLIFGYPSIYSKYLEGFHTKNPEKWYDVMFNVIFWIFISVAYYSYRKVSSKYGFIKTKIYYGLGMIGSFLFITAIIFPILERIIT